jgi:PAS domain S-box-containing protein
MTAALQVYRAHVKAFRDIADQRFRATVAIATRDSNRAMASGVAIAATGLAASLLFGLFVALVIKRQVNAVVGSFKGIAEGAGELNRRIPVTTTDEMGDLVHWFNTFVGKLEVTIAERLAAEDQLRKLGVAVAQSPDSVVIVNGVGRTEYVNSAFLDATGLTRSEALGVDALGFSSRHTPSAALTELTAAVRGGGAWQGELVNERKDGATYVCSARVSPIRQDDGQVSHYLVIDRGQADRRRIDTPPQQPRGASGRAHPGAGVRARRSGKRQPSEDHLSGQYEPRDPHAA